MEEKNLKLQEEAKRYVYSIGRWYKFFGILSIIGAVMMVLGALMFIVIGSAGPMAEAMAESGMPPLPMWLLGVLYLVMAGLMVPVIIYLLRAASDAESATALNCNEAAVRFLRNTKRFWKFYGILTIVVLALCIVVMPIAMVAGVMSAL